MGAILAISVDRYLSIYRSVLRGSAAAAIQASTSAPSAPTEEVDIAKLRAAVMPFALAARAAAQPPVPALAPPESSAATEALPISGDATPFLVLAFERYIAVRRALRAARPGEDPEQVLAQALARFSIDTFTWARAVEAYARLIARDTAFRQHIEWELSKGG